jgi:hypothetical protein
MCCLNLGETNWLLMIALHFCIFILIPWQRCIVFGLPVSAFSGDRHRRLALRFHSILLANYARSRLGWHSGRDISPHRFDGNAGPS